MTRGFGSFGIPAIFAVALALSVAVPQLLAAQELTLDQVEQLISENPAYTAYRQQLTAISRLFHSLKAEGMPTMLLDDLLREAAAKHVKSAQLLDAMESTAARIRTAAGILKAQHIWPQGLDRESTTERAQLVQRIGIVLQGGVSPLIISTLLENATGADTSAKVGRVLRLCETLVAIVQVARVPEPDLLSMALSLLSSRLPEASFQSLPGLFVRGRVDGVDSATLAQTITAVAARGGGIIRMDTEIRRLGGRQ